jgi:hypothetical protein
MAATSIVPGVYEHYKGEKYFVLGLSRDTETAEVYVVYCPLYESDWPHLFHRNVTMFCENVNVEGKEVPRFKFVSASQLDLGAAAQAAASAQRR